MHVQNYVEYFRVCWKFQGMLKTVICVTAAGWRASNTRLYFRAGRSRVRLVYVLGHYGDSVCYSDEYYFYFMGRACTNLTETWQALSSRYF